MLIAVIIPASGGITSS